MIILPCLEIFLTAANYLNYVFVCIFLVGGLLKVVRTL